MAKKKKTQNAYEMEMLDLLNEVGGVMTVEYHTLKFTITKEKLQFLRENGLKTDVPTCVMIGLIALLKDKQELIEYLQEAQAAGASPSISFEAADGEALNISSPEDNPMVDTLVQAVSNQQT